MSTPVSLQRDQNFIAVGGGVFDDGSKTIAPLSIASATGRLKVTAILTGVASGFQLPLTGLVNGSNQTYTWSTTPKAIVVDGNTYTSTTQDASATPIWTGTTTTVFTTLTPNQFCFAIA